jgi:hypothetical protein
MGATIFLTVWGPIMSLMEKITYATMNKDGYAPKWVILLVRSVVMILWFTHDAFFAPVFGRGDGCTEAYMLSKVARKEECRPTEQHRLLERRVEKLSHTC